jgi:hypothetical protein
MGYIPSHLSGHDCLAGSQVEGGAFCLRGS